MSYGNASWIADLLIDDLDERRHVMYVRSETCLYGSTAGPWGGIGGAAMSEFTMTLFRLPDHVLLYADTVRMGRVRTEFVDLALEKFPYVKRDWIEVGT